MVKLNGSIEKLPSIVVRGFDEHGHEEILSGDVLDAAAKETGETSGSIRKSLKIIPLRGTDFIKITAHHDNRVIAVRIANAVAEAYITKWKDIEAERVKTALFVLDEELKKQRDLVQNRRKILTVLIQNYGGPPVEKSGAGSIGITEEALYRKAQEKLDELGEDSAQLKIQIKSLETLKQPRELLQVIQSSGLPSNRVAQYNMEYREIEQSISSLRARGLGLKHPEVEELKKKAQVALSKAEKEVGSLAKDFKTRLKLVNRQTKRIREIIETKNFSDIHVNMPHYNYSQAQAEYENARDLLTQMKIKQKEARILLKIPREPVKMHERAK